MQVRGTAHPVGWDNPPFAAELFARGYGPCQICVNALRYFRLERIVHDVVAFCGQLHDRALSGSQASAETMKDR